MKCAYVGADGVVCGEPKESSTHRIYSAIPIDEYNHVFQPEPAEQSGEQLPTVQVFAETKDQLEAASVYGAKVQGDAMGPQELARMILAYDAGENVLWADICLEAARLATPETITPATTGVSEGPRKGEQKSHGKTD
jgi:hypothetical protein